MVQLYSAGPQPHSKGSIHGPTQAEQHADVVVDIFFNGLKARTD